MNSYETYLYWIQSKYFDEETKSELLKIRNKPKEIEDRFFKELDFGTGGLRGIIGAGTNRMNIYTVRKASQGLANYLIKQGNEAKTRGIAIAYDSRFKSAEFALEAAKVFTGNGIKTYLFDELRPTPELAFAVRFLGAIAGVAITASHNPKEYNGYKVYGEDGAQLMPEITAQVTEEINKITDLTTINFTEKDDALDSGLLKIIGKEIDDAYISWLRTLSFNGNLTEGATASLKIVYTPLHGTGYKLVRRILNETGFKNVLMVENQKLPDAEFTNAKPVPNPEEPGVYKHAVKSAIKYDADLIIATDPDCDRVGVMTKKSENRYVLLSGNQVGVLLMDYVLSMRQEASELPHNSFIVKSIVTTEMAKVIADSYNVELIDVLTGFKYIGEKIKELDEFGGKNFILGIEDSCGYLTGTYVRDKDGVLASMLIAEAAAYHKQKGKTLYEALQDLYKKYGFYFGDMLSYSFKGKAGMNKILNGMASIRENAWDIFSNIEVSAVRDYLKQKRYELKTRYEALNLPKSDVLYYEISDGSWFCIRPSGTEPKIKIYFEASDRDEKIALKKLRILKKKVLRKIKKLFSPTLW